MEEQHHYQKTKTLHREALRFTLLFLLLLGMFSINGSVAVPDRTCLSRNLFLTSDYFIGAYPKTAELTVERVLDNNRIAADADSRSWRYEFPSSGEDKFGAFTCVFDQNEVRITTILLSENGDVTPESPTVTVSVGEDVTLRMSQSFTGSSTELRWKHNGDNVTAWNGLSNVTLTNVRGSDAGIYECYRDGYYDQQRHAIMKLLVRECPAGKWGPRCSGDCPFCWNGGVCDDKTGECVCTPGFSGDLCETLNGYNHWGQDGNIQCTYKTDGDPVEACRGRLMCHPDPLGCTCATGFTALDCMQDCPNGYFGAGCEQECHCAGGVACDKGHGKCPNGVECAAGYTGENCQGCPDGFFGADCRYACHCEGNETCNKENGKCPVGVPCAADYRGDNCQNVCPTGTIGEYTDSCVSCLVPVYVSTPARLKTDTNTLEWNQAYSRCPVSEYKVQSKLLNKEQCLTVDEDFTNLTSVTPKVISYNLSAADSSLHAYSTYKFRVVAINEAGVLEYPEFEIEYTTQEKAPTVSPANVRTSTIEVNRLSFLWDEVPCGYRGGSNLTYSCKLTPTPGSDVLTKEVTSLEVNINVLPCTHYLFEVAAKNVRIGELGPYSAGLPVATGTKAHGPVNSLAVHSDTSGSSTQMTVTWSSPDTSQNLCSLRYIVEYELTSLGQCGPVASPQREPAANQTTTSATITGLEAYSTYKVYVRTWNAAGYSEERGNETNTPSKEPSEPPTNIHPDSKTRYSISFSWSEIPCLKSNGEITQYQIQFRALEKPYMIGFMPNDTYTTDTLPSSTMQCNISGLEPSTTYEIRLAGVNDAGRGPLVNANMSTSVETELDPPAKSSYEPSKATSTTVTISLNLPSTSTYITGVQVGVRQVPAVVKRATKLKQLRSADSKIDYVAGELSKGGLPETFTVGDGKTYGGFGNKPLMIGTEYDIFLGSVSRISDEEYSVAWGEPLRVKVYATSGPDPEGFPVAAIVVPVLIVVILGIVAAGIIFRRRRSKQESSKQRCQFNAENSEIQIGNCAPQNVSEHSRHTAGAASETTSEPKTPSISPAPPQKPKPEPTSRKKPPVTPDPVPLKEFGDYVSMKKATSYKEGNGYLQDYENLQDITHPCSVARHEKNKEKNRYANIIPYDTSRVVLDKLPDDPFSDYINACYVDGFRKPNCYIASQGPNKASTADMWRMVWQENTAKIVMLTNLQEGIKGKCEKYWPDKAAAYGSLTVRLTSEEQQADYTVRDFTIGMDSEEQPNRKVRQYHYTSWPDMGLPRDPGKVVNFINTVKEYNPKDAGPMIVHCSAGIGRTGVFIVLDSMFDQAKEEGRVDVWNFVRGMRDKRMKMIQTAAQYEFIFDTLLETFQCGDTTVKPEMLRAALAELKRKKKGSGKTGLQQQFESLNLMTGPSNAEQCRGGRDPSNVNKNRFPDKIPVDRFRPHLMTPGEEGSRDYINACFLNSFNAKGTYIATQMPLRETIGDIWRMVYDYNSSCVVMLNSWDHKDPSFGQYLPTGKKPISCGALSVTMESTEKLENNIAVRYLTLTNDKRQDSRVIYHLQLLDWPRGGVPASPASVMKLVTAVRVWQNDHEGERIVVHCIDGEGVSGTFCALLNILERLQDEKVIDVFQAVKRIRENRSRMVQTLEQYQFLYAAAQFHLDTNTVYENL